MISRTDWMLVVIWVRAIAVLA